MFGLGSQELLVILVIVLILFGANRLPQLARSLGSSLKEVKTGIGGAIVAALVAACGWLVLTDAPAYQFLVRLYVDKRFLKHTLREWGVLAPVIFMGLQALQVIIAPIPGELTGILGGYLFGEWVG